MNISAETHPILWQHLPALRACVEEAQLPSNEIIVGLSGGVDSSVTALVLKALGYNVAGLFMKNWDEDDGTEYCTAKQDLADAQAVANEIGIKLHTANFAAEYWDNVFEDFLQSYKAGFTPNPDVLCNREIKFQVFKQYAEHLGYTCIATGHYARTRNTPEGVQLRQSVDDNKDQTYFLNGVMKSQLTHVTFPLGCIDKPTVRQIAEEAGLATQKKKDSTGICFIGERRFKDFLSQYLPAQPGGIYNDQDEKLGDHQGLMYYTLGQRRGIGIGGVSNTSENPWYVARKDLKNNRLYIVQDPQHPWLMSYEVQLQSINWITHPSLTATPEEIETGIWKGLARCRHRQQLVPVSLRLDDGDQPRVTFDSPEWAVTPGQYLVLYRDGICLGGGPIKSIQHQQIAESNS
ncbi:MAG: tRNA 2-thiouridine(34) synthase MnmA [Pseudomonadota bacterium]|nr:tRNA 2-thiouridine(34) synthase MnmA [Pseudomonadota bacterium]